MNGVPFAFILCNKPCCCWQQLSSRVTVKTEHHWSNWLWLAFNILQRISLSAWMELNEWLIGVCPKLELNLCSRLDCPSNNLDLMKARWGVSCHRSLEKWSFYTGTRKLPLGVHDKNLNVIAAVSKKNTQVNILRSFHAFVTKLSIHNIEGIACLA